MMSVKKKKRLNNTTLWISLPDKPGQLGNVSSLIGQHKLNISNLEMVSKNLIILILNFN